jgi:tetratricopeptide (TPR) repeat protein
MGNMKAERFLINEAIGYISFRIMLAIAIPIMAVVGLMLPLSCASKNSQAYYIEGNTLYSSKKYAEAVQKYTKAIAIDPCNYASYHGRAMAKCALADYHGCIADLDTVLFHNKSDAYVYYERGNAKHLLGDEDGACMDWNSACDLQYNRACDLRAVQCDKR